MSTITTTPVPTVGRTPVIIGIAVLGVVTVAAVTIPRLQLEGTTTSPTTAQVQAPDALDRHDAMVAAAEARSSRTTEGMLDAQARTIGHQSRTVSSATTLPTHLTELGALATAYGAAATSVGREQVGRLQGHYEIGTSSDGSVSEPTAAQAGGLHKTFVYDAQGPKGLHLTWSDPWVPPVADPAWVPFVRAHYYGGTVPERVVTRGD
jgi:hypothetical protein